jgi:uncharacterized phage-associated protein
MKDLRPQGLTSREVADYFLSKAASEEDGADLISNLKLQKLLYYAQGVHMALQDTPLFEEDIQAWQHGPVVPSIYQQYKDYGGNSLSAPALGTIDFTRYTPEEQETLSEVYNVYGQFSAWRLREMTHSEGPWKDYYKEGQSAIIIPKMALNDYFKTLVI